MDFQYDDPFHYSRPCQLFRVHKMVEAVIRSVDKRTACTLEAALNNMTVPLHEPKTSLNIYSTWGPLCNGCYVLFRGARKEKISGMMSRNYVATKSSATKRHKYIPICWRSWEGTKCWTHQLCVQSRTYVLARVSGETRAWKYSLSETYGVNILRTVPTTLLCGVWGTINLHTEFKFS